jgi:KUP system potassium uptake protein
MTHRPPSQTVITGAYSLTRQAIQLGLLPRLEIRHTSEAQFGQIYIPRINFLLLIGVILLVVLFRSSGALASAYGIAVTGTMVVTATLALIVVWQYWKWPLWAAACLMVPFLLIDLTFLGANLLKVFQGGWVPLLIGAMVMIVMITWRKGARILAAKTRRLETPIDGLICSLEARQPIKVPGTAVFLTADPESAPTALLHSLKHYKVLHEHNIVLTIIIESTPRVAAEDRVSLEPLGKAFTRLLIRFGFMETPNTSRRRSPKRGSWA